MSKPGINCTVFKITLKKSWFMGNPLIEEETITEKLEKIKSQPAIILYNDDFNTFEHVIDCLMVYCGHGYEQAGQCANIVHHNGKCDVKHGSYEELLPIYEALLNAKLTAKIEV